VTFEGKSWTFQCYIKDQHETAVLSRGYVTDPEVGTRHIGSRLVFIW
jgi:hypothetical protein